MSATTADARRWVCSRCGVAVGQMDGHLVPLPSSWESCAEGDFCLACQRSRAADAAQDSAPDGCSTTDRAKARRTGLIEFEVRRTPDLTDGAIAKVCRTSGAAVAAARKRLAHRG
jgi:hypothetical protein